jgi:hypothetical protein
MPVFTSRAEQGHPNLVALMTPHRSAAMDFYADLFGWDYLVPAAGSTRPVTATLGGVRVALITEEPEFLVQEGAPPQWQVFLQVDDLRVASARLEATGGTLLASFVTGGVAQVVMAQDPSGALINFRTVEGDADARVEDEPGAPGWFELVAEDYERTFAFYREVAGLDTTTVSMGDGQPAYTLFTCGARAIGGAWPPEQPGTHARWRVYFTVESLETSVALALGLGAQLEADPVVATGVGSWAALSDPHGALFSVLQPE